MTHLKSNGKSSRMARLSVQASMAIKPLRLNGEASAKVPPDASRSDGVQGPSRGEVTAKHPAMCPQKYKVNTLYFFP